MSNITRTNATLSESSFRSAVSGSVLLANAYVQLLVFAAGVCGNVLVLCVFVRRKRLRTTSFAVYFGVLVVSDSLVLVDCLHRFAKSVFGVDTGALLALACHARPYVHYAFCAISAHMLTLVAVDRYLSIVHPTRFVARTWRWVQCTAAGHVVAFNLLVYIPTWLAQSFVPLDQASSFIHHF